MCKNSKISGLLGWVLSKESGDVLLVSNSWSCLTKLVPKHVSGFSKSQESRIFIRDELRWAKYGLRAMLLRSFIIAERIVCNRFTNKCYLNLTFFHLSRKLDRSNPTDRIDENLLS